MPRRKLKESYEYQYGPRSVLRVGDRFRVKGGPIYITDEGVQIPMYDRGVFVFQKYCERGAQKWIEARHAGYGTTSILWVGRRVRSPLVPNMIRRPYRITRKVRQNDQTGRRRRRTQTEAMRI